MPAFRGLSAAGKRTRLLVASVSAVLMFSFGLAGYAQASPAAVGSASPAKASGGQISGEPGVCPSCSPPLTQHAGPVVGTAAQTGEVTITPIYWTPPGYGFVDASGANFDNTAYSTVINKYITDTAADSGKTTNVYANNTQYQQTVNGVTTSIHYLIHAGTPITDTNAFPTAGQCTVTAPYTACITNQQYQTELQSILTARGLPADLGHIYVLLFPYAVQEQFTGSSGPAVLSDAYYCGIHGSFSAKGGGTALFVEQPFDTTSCFATSIPVPSEAGSTAINTLSHEINETITDPLQGANRDWIDSGGNEIGDECANNYGPQLGTFDQGIGYGPQPYNAVINGHDYYTQTEFSNSAYAALGVGKGCVETPFVAAPMAQAHARADAKRSTLAPDDAGSVSSDVSLDATPAAVPADGTSTSTVTITDLDASGEPVVGDQMFLSTRLDVASTLTQGSCGNLGNPRGQTATTDANGQIVVTYTATTDNAECYVEATDLSQGTTNEVLIYQGSDKADAPTVTQTTPASLTAGGPAVTFTATGTNPSGAGGVADARFDLHLTGDSSGSTGLNASDLMLSYKDGATNGDFVNVPLSGTTANDGQIDGFVIPDTAETLPAGASRTATFQLALAAGAPTTATTGSPLAIETDLDNFDPADGSAGNLDFTTGSVPVVANPGDSITYSGKLSTTKAPTATANGSATLVANTCQFASDASKCTLTGTATLTLTGGTLTGFVSTNKNNGVGDRTFSFTETFTTSTTGTTITGSGTGTGQIVFFDDGSTSDYTVADAFTEKPTSVAKVDTDQGTLTLTPTS
jgi:hypothetical protein